MVARPTKYIFITGGVLSGLGKGIAAASLGNLLKASGFKVNLQKCDPYLNVDAGLLNPREHGECFVTKDGAETDLDLGHYERFLDEELTQSSSLMSGRVLLKLIQDERAGKYEGHSVQVVPHFTGAIEQFISDASEGFDVHIVEIGGTVGDYESLPFIESIRDFGLRVGRENCLYVHVVYLPYLGASQETKTKPAQNSVRDLRGFGIMPDVLIARSETDTVNGSKHKLSMFCGVPEEAIVLLPNAKTVYEVPLTLEASGIGTVVEKRLGLKPTRPDMSGWRELVARATKRYAHTVKVGIVAKYLDNADTYLCVFEALKAAGWASDIAVDIQWIDAVKLETMTDAEVAAALSAVDGIVVPGGFGSRGVEGKIRAARYALDQRLPYLGLCYGLQMAVIAAARKHGLRDAHTTEVDRVTGHPVISTIEGQEGKENTGGTMRLGNYVCALSPDSEAAALYGATDIVERHRHRYECNPAYVDQYTEWGIRAVGRNPGTNLVEVIEVPDHPFFMASQFHPEFKSRPNRPHPLFLGFVRAAAKVAKNEKLR
ncbi:MAG TPA: CTP synthase [Candidatus Saccharimonadales bacterium]|nr:CTP synthase [Candidatus Saccharimonadales bacterium]